MSKVSPLNQPKPEPKRNHQGGSAPASPIPARWLLSAVGLVLLGAALGVWATLCLTFWQGSWQLLYHPASAVTQTPASAGIAFDRIAFGSSETGIAQLQGWWCKAVRPNGYTTIYFHDAKGNLGDTVQALAPLHAAGFDVFAFDYRGYGQSQFAHPSEAHWKQDAESSINYLIQTRHVAPEAVVVAGRGLGADLALEIAAAHPEFAGVIVESPISDPAAALFGDPRARLVPAHWLVADRWDLNRPAVELKIPSLWFCRSQSCGLDRDHNEPAIFQAVSSPKVLVRLAASGDTQAVVADELSQWTADLNKRR
jgi:uncharacterized protein